MGQSSTYLSSLEAEDGVLQNGKGVFFKIRYSEPLLAKIQTLTERWTNEGADERTEGRTHNSSEGRTEGRTLNSTEEATHSLCDGLMNGQFVHVLDKEMDESQKPTFV